MCTCTLKVVLLWDETYLDILDFTKWGVVFELAVFLSVTCCYLCFSSTCTDNLMKSSSVGKNDEIVDSNRDITLIFVCVF